MPLSRDHWPVDEMALTRLLFERDFQLRNLFLLRHHDPLTAGPALKRVISQFWVEATNKLIPRGFTNRFLHEVANLIGHLYEYYEEEPPAIWEMMNELLTSAGLQQAPPAGKPPKTSDDFYKHAGPGHASTELATQVLIGYWK